MPCPHNEISIVQRSQQQSAVAAAAYQSGEKLFCEYDQEVKHYPEKRGIVHNEILLPANAPQKYADRNTLWNAAEAVEKQWNSQLARRWVLTIPREIPPDQYAVLVREFCEQQFVSKGMIADFAIHDPHPPGHNPHAHVLLTMRAIDRNAKGQQTVHFMNLVDEADLLALMDKDTADAYTAEKEAAAKAEQDKLKAEEEAKKAAEEAAKVADAPKENKVTKYAAGFLGVVALIALAAGGGFYFYVQQKNKKQAEKESIDPDADYTEDKGDFEIPPEDDSDEDDTPDEEDTEPI